ncbi:MAG: DUF2142 domain-containing protein [Hungatella sp.]
MKQSEKRSWKQPVSVLCLSAFVFLVLMALVHAADVRQGAAATGDGWLLGNYAILAAAVLALTSVLGFFFFYGKKWKMESLFVMAAAGFGILYLFVLPPLSAPDEVSHYISAYKLSNQMLGKTATEEHGLVYIREEDQWIEDIYGELSVDGASVEDGSVQPDVLGQTLTEETYRLIHEKGWLGGEADGNSNENVISNQWTVRTTPLAYVPQALGMTLVRLFGAGSISLLFMGRLMNLAFYVAVTYLAMKRLPFGKEVLFGVALLPMTLHLTGSMSYDTVILGLTFYFTAVCLDLAYEKEQVRVRDSLTLAAVIFVLGPCKMVYAAVMGLCLLIPVRKFGGWKRYLTAAAVVLAAFVVSMVLVNSQTIVTYATETETYVSWAEEAGYSFAQLLGNPKLVLRLFYNTLVWQAEHYHMTMIGAWLGNVDVVLEVPYLTVCWFTISLLLLTLRKPGEMIQIRGGQRIWVWVTCFGCAAAILFSMLLAWTPVSSRIITGVQGRYFLPILPVFLMSIKQDFAVLTRNRDREILFLMCVVNAYVLLRLFSIVSMRI